MKANIINVVRRGNNSRIAAQLQNLEFEKEKNITVSQNAPCSIKVNGCYPSQRGWREIDRNSNIISLLECEIWIKTATLGGRRRMWVR